MKIAHVYAFVGNEVARVAEGSSVIYAIVI